MKEKPFEGAKAYLTIPVGISRDKDLLKKPKTILLMGEILTMLNTTGSFYMSNTQIGKRLNVSKRTVADYIKILADKKLIAKELIRDPHNDKIILGRKIRGGADLGKYTALGWRNTFSNPSETDCADLGKPTSPKEYQSNKAVNKASNNNEQSSLTVEKIASEFESLWARYPNKKGKKDAFNHYKHWRKSDPKKYTKEYFEKKLNDYLAYIQQKHIEPEYIMHGSTWFNGRFDDELEVKDVSNALPANGGYANANNVGQDVSESDMPF